MITQDFQHLNDSFHLFRLLFYQIIYEQLNQKQLHSMSQYGQQIQFDS